MADGLLEDAALPGVQYMPSNGSEGYQFIEDWCCRCDRDQEMGHGVPFDECDEDKLCPILAASFRGEAPEWRELPGGKTLCTAFRQVGVIERCPNTIDMFAQLEARAASEGTISSLAADTP